MPFWPGTATDLTCHPPFPPSYCSVWVTSSFKGLPSTAAYLALPHSSTFLAPGGSRSHLPKLKSPLSKSPIWILSQTNSLFQCVLEHTLSRPTPHTAIHDVSHQCPPLQQFLSQVTLQLPVPELPLITAVPSRTRSPRKARNRFSQPLHLSLKNLLQMNSLNINLPNNPCSKKSQL